ncbi:MAG TPA: hypothetical protein HPQ00_08290, partial [Magnetococcales bacterium]|nr:hypothetical protein [Magnetococcales bacterium]
PMQERLPALLRALMATIHNLCPPDEQQVILLAEPLKRSILAMGVESKNSLAWGSRAQVTLSPPLGDLADPTARTALEEAVRRRMDDASPECIAVDLHPDMFPSLLGRRLARERGIPVIAVQHHFAHAAACMAESGLKESLALAFDGMGWGTDATLWGAELLHMVPGQSRRLGTFTPVPLPGGDAAVRRPVRQLLARRVDAGVEISAGWCQRLGLSATEAAIWTHQCRNHLHAPLSHAAGRLFDAFAAQLGVAPQTITHEGEPAIRLEALARSFSGKIFPHHHLPFSLREHGEMVYIDWRETFRQFPEDRVFGPDEAALWAYVFHQAVAAAMLAMVEFGTKRTGLGTVVLSGGVFMNKILTQRLAGDLQDRGYRVFQHQRVPTGDAGIALGQVWMIGGME